MGRINVLDKNVAEKIAAGEVVERPSSVVKELIENSFDANATSVTVEIEKGGTSYIRVTDNGQGIENDDVATAFLRHATSKIKDEKDLEGIPTLGFRGEALCSISAVSRCEMITRTEAEQMGTYMAVEGGDTVEYSRTGAPLGTTMTVRKLFFNTPARMKFLKKDATESGYVTDICQRAALSHPEISFRYIRDGKDIFFTPGDNILKNTVRAIFGKDISNAMTEVCYTEGVYSIKGLTGTNKLSRPNRNMQYFFVNGRLVKSNLLSLAMNEAYKNELMVGKFPVCVIDIRLPWDMVDVNVHPAKTEVKFVSEEEVYRHLVLAVKAALFKGGMQRSELKSTVNAFKLAVESSKSEQTVLKTNPFGAVKNADRQMFKPVVGKKEGSVENSVKAAEKTAFTPMERVERREKNITVSSPEELPQRKIESISVREETAPFYKNEEKDIEKEEKPILNADAEKKAETTEEKQIEIPPFRVVGQLFATYIIIESENEMIMIDQHAAHERINYEKIKNSGCVKQTVLLPSRISLTPKEKAVWEENREFLDKMGFDSDDFGQNEIIVRAFPSDVDFAVGEDLLLEIISSLMGEEKGEISYLRDKAVYTVACKAAIKANKVLSEKEMEQLVREVFLAQGISTCPHGRPIFVNMTKYQIEKMFKRIV